MSLAAIDEAHCASSWGHDFRPAYLAVGAVLDRVAPRVPRMALTATLAPRAESEAVRVLGLGNAPPNSAPRLGRLARHAASMDRPNIEYAVRMVAASGTLGRRGRGAAARPVADSDIDDDGVAGGDEARCDDLVGALRARGMLDASGIIFCHSRRTCGLVATLLKRRRIVAAAYHAGMRPDDRESVQDRWMKGEIKIVVATIAFGMGVDRQDVRFVVHWTLPRSLAAYYQESGRCGRDGAPALALAYHSARENGLLLFLAVKDAKSARRGAKRGRGKRGRYGAAAATAAAAAAAGAGAGADQPPEDKVDAVREVLEFATAPTCRRAALLLHLGESLTPAIRARHTVPCCDACADPVAARTAAAKIKNDIDAQGGARAGKRKLADVVERAPARAAVVVDLVDSDDDPEDSDSIDLDAESDGFVELPPGATAEEILEILGDLERGSGGNSGGSATKSGSGPSTSSSSSAPPAPPSSSAAGAPLGKRPRMMADSDQPMTAQQRLEEQEQRMARERAKNATVPADARERARETFRKWMAKNLGPFGAPVEDCNALADAEEAKIHAKCLANADLTSASAMFSRLVNETTIEMRRKTLCVEKFVPWKRAKRV
jgi:hypothetical protein